MCDALEPSKDRQNTKAQAHRKSSSAAGQTCSISLLPASQHVGAEFPSAGVCFAYDDAGSRACPSRSACQRWGLATLLFALRSRL